MFHNSTHVISVQKQQGFLLPLALVIIIGVGSLAVAVSKLTSRSGASATQEGLSLHAFYAAESGAQYAMNQIFFSASTRTSTDANCTNVSGTSVSFGSSVMSHCSANITCSRSINADDTVSFYEIISLGSCGSGQITGQRTIAVQARM